MSMIFARPSQHPADRSFRLDPIWFLAVLAMTGLSACSFLLNPEQSLALALGFLILLIALADLRAGFLAYIALYPFIPITWGVDVAEWMPYPPRVETSSLGEAAVLTGALAVGVDSALDNVFTNRAARAPSGAGGAL